MNDTDEFIPQPGFLQRQFNNVVANDKDRRIAKLEMEVNALRQLCADALAWMPLVRVQHRMDIVGLKTIKERLHAAMEERK